MNCHLNIDNNNNNNNSPCAHVLQQQPVVMMAPTVDPLSKTKCQHATWKTRLKSWRRTNLDIWKKEWLFVKRFVKASESWCFASWQKISKSINQQQQQQEVLTTTSAQWQRINKKILHVKQKKATETVAKKWNRQTRKSTIAHDEICWFASQASTKPVGCWGTWKEEKPFLSCKSH